MGGSGQDRRDVALHDELLEIIDLCRKRGTPVAVGGPAGTSAPHFYSKANFWILGDVEDILCEFITAWDGGAREGAFQAKKFVIDVIKLRYNGSIS